MLRRLYKEAGDRSTTSMVVGYVGEAPTGTIATAFHSGRKPVGTTPRVAFRAVLREGGGKEVSIMA